MHCYKIMLIFFCLCFCSQLRAIDDRIRLQNAIRAIETELQLGYPCTVEFAKAYNTEQGQVSLKITHFNDKGDFWMKRVAPMTLLNISKPNSIVINPGDEKQLILGNPRYSALVRELDNASTEYMLQSVSKIEGNQFERLHPIKPFIAVSLPEIRFSDLLQQPGAIVTKAPGTDNILVLTWEGVPFWKVEPSQKSLLIRGEFVFDLSINRCVKSSWNLAGVKTPDYKSFEYDNKGVPKRMIVNSFVNDQNFITLYDIISIDHKTAIGPKEKVCYLSYYGLPEPSFPGDSKPSWNWGIGLYGTIACIVFLFASYFILKKRYAFV